MSLDQTTESIAHFAGLFHLAIEELRLREQYLEFTSQRDAPIEDERFEFNPVKFSAPYRLGDFDPKLRVSADDDAPRTGAAPSAPVVPPPAPGNSGAPFPEVVRVPGAPIDDNGGSASSPLDFISGPSGVFQGLFFANQVIVIPFVPIPPSVITVTVQQAILNDNDVLGDISAAGFVDPSLLKAELQSLIKIAEAMQPWSSETLVASLSDGAAATIEFMESLQDIPSDGLGVQVVLRGDQAVATTVNGEAVDKIPNIEDVLPDFISNKRSNDGPDNADAKAALAGDRKAEEGLFDSQTGYHETFANSAHNVVSGANESHNIVEIQSGWIDAPVIAVAGDVVELHAISQVNILSDSDTFDGIAKAHEAFESQAINAAHLDLGVPDGASQDPIALESGAQFGSDIFPLSWNIDRFDGDVIISNVVQQHSFNTDFDRLDLTFAAQSTTIVSGENQIANTVSIEEFAGGYDFIAIGGSMVTTNVIEQTNVLFDDDAFVGDGLGAASVAGNDNLLLNIAEITKHAYDQHAEMLDDFKDALRDLAKGAAELAREVATSDLFEGNETLRALYIDGDLVQMNIIDQINYLGDVDQIQMMADAMQSAVDDMPVSITAGSNMLSNSASIHDVGTDSVIMSNGSHYSDALLVQAELIDTDANPLGVSIADLASEAVAFLADEIIAEHIQARLDEGDLHTGGTSLDVMETLTV